MFTYERKLDGSVQLAAGEASVERSPMSAVPRDEFGSLYASRANTKKFVSLPKLGTGGAWLSLVANPLGASISRLRRLFGFILVSRDDTLPDVQDHLVSEVGDSVLGVDRLDPLPQVDEAAAQAF